MGSKLLRVDMNYVVAPMRRTASAVSFCLEEARLVMLGLRALLDNTPERAFRLMAIIKQQRPVFPPPDGKVAQPRVIVRRSPEGDGVNVIPVLRQQFEQLLVPLLLLLQHFSGRAN